MADYDPKDANMPAEGDIEVSAADSIDKKSLDEMNEHIQNILQQMREKFQTMSEQILSKIDDMGNRIDDLEKNICDLMNHAGLETPDK